MPIKYLDAVSMLHSNGHPHLASAAIAHYERLASGTSAEHRCRVSAMFDEVLETALQQGGEITATDILLSPDFAAIRALAHILKKLNLVDEVEIEIELTDLDLIQGEFIEAIKPPAPPLATIFDDVEILPPESPYELILLEATRPGSRFPQRRSVMSPTLGMKPSRRLP